MFQKSLDLMMQVEAKLVNKSISENKFVRYFQRLLLLPWRFVKLGIKEKTHGVFVWAFLCGAAIVLEVLLLGSSLQKFNNEFSIFNLFVFTIAFLLVTFAVPSIYSNNGVSSNDVANAKNKIIELNITTEKEIEILKKSMRIFEDRAKDRITSLKWVVGLSWAGFLYMYSLFLDGFKTKPTSTANFQNDILSIAYFMLFVLAAYIFVWGYESAISRLFKTIEHACNELSYELLSATTEAQPLIAS